jgi:hypothetical protein
MSRSIRSAGIAIVATLITSVAAAQTPGAGDACSLLSKEDAAAALGEAATGPKATGPMKDGQGNMVSACEYTGSGIHSIDLNLWRLSPSTAPMYKMICAKKTKDGLDGLGDVACWYNERHAELQVIKGTSFVSIKLGRSGNSTEPIITAMKKALAKLK